MPQPIQNSSRCPSRTKTSLSNTNHSPPLRNIFLATFHVAFTVRGVGKGPRVPLGSVLELGTGRSKWRYRVSFRSELLQCDIWDLDCTEWGQYICGMGSYTIAWDWEI